MITINLQYGDVDVGESTCSNKTQDNHPVTTRRHTVGPGNGLMTQVTNYFFYFIYESKSPLFYSVYNIILVSIYLNIWINLCIFSNNVNQYFNLVLHQ